MIWLSAAIIRHACVFSCITHLFDLSQNFKDFHLLGDFIESHGVAGGYQWRCLEESRLETFLLIASEWLDEQEKAGSRKKEWH
jgi:hypothetical protein